MPIGSGLSFAFGFFLEVFSEIEELSSELRRNCLLLGIVGLLVEDV